MNETLLQKCKDAVFAYAIAEEKWYLLYDKDDADAADKAWREMNSLEEAKTAAVNAYMYYAQE